MNINLSKDQWKFIGEKTGWIKSAAVNEFDGKDEKKVNEKSPKANFPSEEWVISFSSKSGVKGYWTGKRLDSVRENAKIYINKIDAREDIVRIKNMNPNINSNGVLSIEPLVENNPIDIQK